MEPGRLNCLVQIQVNSGTRDGAGQPVANWTELAKVWADIKHPSGAEAIAADKVVSVVKASIKVRKRADVTAAMRVVHGATIYAIKAVLPDERSRQHMFLACEVVHV
jgi:SPP1 family predicted phage head-tail adaptor